MEILNHLTKGFKFMLKRTVSKKFIYITIAALLALTVIGKSLATIDVAPFRAFSGVVWLKEGFHYISEISLRFVSNE